VNLVDDVCPGSVDGFIWSEDMTGLRAAERSISASRSTAGRNSGDHQRTREYTGNEISPEISGGRQVDPAQTACHTSDKDDAMKFLRMFLLPLCVGIIWIIWNSLRYSKIETAGMRSINWPEATGTIIRSAVVSLHVEVQYRYCVEGIEYSGKHIANRTPDKPHQGFGAIRAMQEETAQLLRSYPVGSKAIIHYNPERHDESVLYCSAEPVNHKPSQAPEFRALD
jgi:hypothetical protein